MAKLDIINYKGTPCEIVPEIAPLFKTTETYAAGDHVIYEADWYTFKEAKEAGAWDATKVDGPFKVADEIDALKEDLNSNVRFNNFAFCTVPITDGKFLNPEGALITDVTSCVTEFVYVCPHSRVKIEGCSLSGNRSICGYSADYSYSVEIPATDVNGVVTITIPDNVAFIRVTGFAGVAPSFSYVSIQEDYLDQNATIEPFAMDAGYMITSAPGYEGYKTAQASSAASDFISVLPDTVVKIENCFLTSYRSVCAYGKQKQFVKVIMTGSGLTTVYAKIPSNAHYIRITSALDTVPSVSYVSYVLKSSMYAHQYAKNRSLFDTSALKPVLSFIDDDTWNSTYVTRLKGVFENLGLKCSFAVLTEQVDAEEGFLAILKGFEQDGFPMVYHANQQISAYNTATLNQEEEEEDFVKGLQRMHEFGFANYRIWCTPFGSSRDDQVKLAYKYGMQGLITSGAILGVNNPYDIDKFSRFSIKRNSLGTSTSTTAADLVDSIANIKAAIDEAANCDGWILVSTHSAYPVFRNGDADSAIADIANYAVSKGFEIRTVNEELARRMPIYNYYEKF